MNKFICKHMTAIRVVVMIILAVAVVIFVTTR